MKRQNFELKSDTIRETFLDLKQNQPAKLRRRLNLSWSNWGFGIETLAEFGGAAAKGGDHVY